MPASRSSLGGSGVVLKDASPLRKGFGFGDGDPDRIIIIKLDQPATALPGARDIPDELTQRNVRLGVGQSTHDPDRWGGCCSCVGHRREFESDLTSTRTRKG